MKNKSKMKEDSSSFKSSLSSEPDDLLTENVDVKNIIKIKREDDVISITSSLTTDPGDEDEIMTDNLDSKSLKTNYHNHCTTSLQDVPSLTEEEKSDPKLAALLKEISFAKSKDLIIRPRSIYYRNENVFKKIESTYKTIKKYSIRLKAHSSSFCIIPREQGLMAGTMHIEVREGGSVWQIVPQEITRFNTFHAIPIPDASTIISIRFTAPITHVLIFEKESFFNEKRQELNKLLELNNDEKKKFGNPLLLTGSGFPDQSTKRSLRLFRDLLPPSVPFYLITDANISGMQIACDYNSPLPFEDPETFQYSNLVEWIGLQSSKWQNFVTDDSQKNPLTKRAKKMAKKLLKNEYCSDLMKTEIQETIKNNFTFELDIASHYSLSQLLQVLLE